MEDGSLLSMNRKMTPKWAGSRSRDPISKFLDPPYNSQNIKGELQVQYINKNSKYYRQ